MEHGALPVEEQQKWYDMIMEKKAAASANRAQYQTSVASYYTSAYGTSSPYGYTSDNYYMPGGNGFVVADKDMEIATGETSS